MTTSSRKPTARWSGARTRQASSTSSSTTTTGRCRSGVIASAPSRPTTHWSMRKQDSGWFTHLHESSSGRFCVIAGGDHETSEQRLIDLANPEAPPRLVAAREEGVQYSIADNGDELFILTNADDAIDFKVMTAPLASPGTRQLARPDPASRGHLCARCRTLRRPHGAAGARQRAARDHHPRSQDRAKSTPSPSMRPPIRSTPWAATSSKPRICGFPIRR